MRADRHDAHLLERLPEFLTRFFDSVGTFAGMFFFFEGKKVLIALRQPPVLGRVKEATYQERRVVTQKR